MHCLRLQLGLLRAGQSSSNSWTPTDIPCVARAHCSATVPKGSYFHTLLCQEPHPWPHTVLNTAALPEV